MTKGTYYRDLLLLYFKQIINKSHKESKPNNVCRINEINTINNSISKATQNCTPEGKHGRTHEIVTMYHLDYAGNIKG